MIIQWVAKPWKLVQLRVAKPRIFLPIAGGDRVSPPACSLSTSDAEDALQVTRCRNVVIFAPTFLPKSHGVQM